MVGRMAFGRVRRTVGLQMVWSSAVSYEIVSIQANSDAAEIFRRERWTHVTGKALPAPLSPERLDSLVTRTDTLLAPLAFGHSQANMTRFTVRVTLVDRKANFVVLVKN